MKHITWWLGSAGDWNTNSSVRQIPGNTHSSCLVWWSVRVHLWTACHHYRHYPASMFIYTQYTHYTAGHSVDGTGREGVDAYVRILPRTPSLGTFASFQFLRLTSNNEKKYFSLKRWQMHFKDDFFGNEVPISITLVPVPFIIKTDSSSSQK